MATILKYSTKKGKSIVERGSHWIGNTLNQVYDNWSSAKQQAYEWCYDKYLATPDHDSFGICSANGWMFTVSWLGKYNGQDALFMETRDNSYVVLFDE